jgi:hypothetical protein
MQPALVVGFFRHKQGPISTERVIHVSQALPPSGLFNIALITDFPAFVLHV